MATAEVHLPRGVVLLDGSMGQELIHRGAGGHGLLWAAQALFKSPRTVQAIHEEYIAAGADVITTNSYSTIRNKFEPAGLEHRLEEMNRLAGELANRARDRSGASVRIAGSLPPQKGSYRPDLVADVPEMEALYGEQAGFLAEYVDFFLCETMSSAIEAATAARAALATGKPAWVSWTLKDTGPPRLRSGETLAAAYEAIRPLGVSGFLLNCSTPESITRAVPELLALTGGPVGAYANGFTPIPGRWDYRGDQTLPPARPDLGPGTYAGFASCWIGAGARMVGGCCEIGPGHIRALRDLIDSRRADDSGARA